jgi:beta-galactosidase
VANRRQFLGKTAGLAAVLSTSTGLGSSIRSATSAAESIPTRRVSLDGIWQFHLDPKRIGEAENWPSASLESQGWSEVTVPHTWQIFSDSTDYFGTAWYRRAFDVPKEWENQALRVEFEGVFHSAEVWVNGTPAGQHLRKGYTAFAFEIARLLRFGTKNSLVVKVDNAFDEQMLPRGRSFDWSNDGGIYRRVSLLVTPMVYIERVDVDAVPHPTNKTAGLDIAVVVRNSSTRAFHGQIFCGAVSQASGLNTIQAAPQNDVAAGAGETVVVRLPQMTISNPSLWHFDNPNLYSLSLQLAGPGSDHQFTTDFGIRRIEVKDGSFYLNGERVRLMGVERMAGSNPEFGMPEPTSWIDHDHDDLKELNCVFTRVHWPQDKRVLEYCDRHGIFIQTEVPTWGPNTFEGMGDEPSPEIMQNGLAQLQEMILRDRNHPCIFSWGLCNEINGQNPPAYKFAQRMLAEAKKLDPGRMCSYASNSLQKNPGADVAGLMDFIEWNEYYESWYPGTPEDLRRSLEEIHQAFPDKPIVISEYGYCACTPERPEGDERRIEVLRAHTAVCRKAEFVGGLIFFCYNDYRTHIGDQGLGVMKQRIHGVVDLLGVRKPSYSVLRDESSPIESLEWSGHPNSFVIKISTRKSIPAYNLIGYTLRGILYGYSDIPLEQQEAPLGPLSPGQSASLELKFKEQKPVRVEFVVVRANGFSALTKIWKP